MTALKFSLAPIRGEEISNARSATGYGFLKHFPGHLEEILDFGNGEATGFRIGVKAGAK
jgi:hypothetical protein